MAAGLRRPGGAVGAARRRAGPGRHRPEHDRRRRADRDAATAIARIAARRTGGPVVILDIAVPRDFDPRIHDGDRTCLFNIDDLKAIREPTLADRRAHSGRGAIVEQETQRFRRLDAAAERPGDRAADRRRGEAAGRGQAPAARLNGKLTDADRGDRGGVPPLAEPVPARADQRAGGGSAAGAGSGTRCWRRCGSCSACRSESRCKRGDGTPGARIPSIHWACTIWTAAIRPLGGPYRQLVAEWKHILPTQRFSRGPSGGG